METCWIARNDGHYVVSWIYPVAWVHNAVAAFVWTESMRFGYCSFSAQEIQKCHVHTDKNAESHIYPHRICFYIVNLSKGELQESPIETSVVVTSDQNYNA